jgi:hypothetical protein
MKSARVWLGLSHVHQQVNVQDAGVAGDQHNHFFVLTTSGILLPLHRTYMLRSCAARMIVQAIGPGDVRRRS